MIRKGTVEDFQVLVKEFLPYLRRQMVVAEDSRRIGSGVLEALENGEVFVVTVNGELAGTSAFDIARFWYSTQDVMVDKWMCVKPKYRRGITAGRMIKAMEKEAKSRGIPFMPQPMGDQSDIAAFSKHYKTVGTVFMKDAQ